MARQDESRSREYLHIRGRRAECWSWENWVLRKDFRVLEASSDENQKREQKFGACWTSAKVNRTMKWTSELGLLNEVCSRTVARHREKFEIHLILVELPFWPKSNEILSNYSTWIHFQTKHHASYYLPHALTSTPTRTCTLQTISCTNLHYSDILKCYYSRMLRTFAVCAEFIVLGSRRLTIST